MIGYEDSLHYLHSDYSFSYVLSLPIKNVVKLLTKSLERHQEEKAWQMYLTKYPQMDEENYIPFREFYKPQQKTEVKSSEEILEEVKGTLDTFKGRWAT